MDNNHPITPSPELVERCMKMVKCWRPGIRIIDIVDMTAIVEMVAQWGADQELEACDAYVSEHTDWPTGYLTSARRPNPPSLKEQALEQLMGCEVHHTIELNIIRQALEALPNG